MKISPCLLPPCPPKGGVIPAEEWDFFKHRSFSHPLGGSPASTGQGASLNIFCNPIPNIRSRFRMGSVQIFCNIISFK